MLMKTSVCILLYYYEMHLLGLEAFGKLGHMRSVFAPTAISFFASALHFDSFKFPPIAIIMSNPTAVPEKRTFGTDAHEEHSPMINYIHMFVVAPALLSLKYRPQWVKYTPHAAAAIVAFHGFRAFQKYGGTKTPF